jgi:type I restriction enzyme S subunit
MNNNTTYKDSPLGKIPSDWEVKTLSKLTTLCTNGFVGKAKEHYDENGTGVLYIQGFNVTEGGFNLYGIKKIKSYFHEKNKKSQLKEGDLLTIQTGDIGVTSIVPKNLEGSNCHALVISRFKREIASPHFYVQFFNSVQGRRILKTIETGSTMKHLNVGDMIHLNLPLPPLPEQTRIAEVLSAWDKAISNVQATIEQLELRNKWLMQELLTGKRRLKGFSGEWKEVRMKEVFDRVTRKNTENNTNVVTISAQRGFVRQTDFFNKNIASEITDNYFLVEKGEFCYNKSYSNGYPWGATKRLNDYEKAVVTTLYICFKIK